jgi:ribosomal silencing factor RsfS
MIIDLTQDKILDFASKEELSPQTNSSIEYLLKERLEKLIFASSQSYITPFAIIAVSNSAKQIDAITSGILKNLKEKMLFNTKIRIDGSGDRGWCIIDLSDCLVNIMTQEKFDKYALEEIIEGKFKNF